MVLINPKPNDAYVDHQKFSRYAVSMFSRKLRGELAAGGMPAIYYNGS